MKVRNSSSAARRDSGVIDAWISVDWRTSSSFGVCTLDLLSDIAYLLLPWMPPQVSVTLESIDRRSFEFESSAYFVLLFAKG